MQDVVNHRSIYELLRQTVEAHPAGTAYQHKRDGAWHDVSWTEVSRQVARISKGLIALGASKGDRVGILAETRLEWTLCDFGISGCGCVTVGIYPSNLAPGCA